MYFYIIYLLNNIISQFFEGEFVMINKHFLNDISIIYFDNNIKQTIVKI